MTVDKIQDIALDLAKNSTKSISSAIIGAITPNFFVTTYHKLIHSKISLTSKDEITAFNYLIDALADFCDPSEPLDISPDIGACWSIFTYTKICESVYEFKNPFSLRVQNQDYSNRTTTKGKTYWDCPFTSAILSLASKAPCMQDNAKQSLAKLGFGYIALVSLTISTFETDESKYNGIKHLNQVVNALISSEYCRKLFGAENTEVLVQLSNRISKFFSIKHAQMGATIIPRAINNFALLSKELASELFSILLVATEGHGKKTISRDYQRILEDQITVEKEPKQFNPNNPYKTLLKTSASCLSALNSEPTYYDSLSLLNLPADLSVKQYITNNLAMGLLGSRNHSALYLFLQTVDAKTQKVVWLETDNLKGISDTSNELIKIAKWLKHLLVISSVVKDLNLLLSMDGQRWLAQGSDAEIIQQFITKTHTDIARLKDDMDTLRDFLRGRLRAGIGPEHEILKKIQKIYSTTETLQTKGISPLLNIEEKFLVVAEYVENVRYQFFARIITRLNNSGLGFLITPVSERNLRRESFTSLINNNIDVSTTPPPRPDAFTTNEITSRLVRWMIDAFSSESRGDFLDFWQKLLYTEKDHGLIKGKKLPALTTFHRNYLHDVKKITQKGSETKGLLETLEHAGTNLRKWAEDSIAVYYKNTLNNSAFLQDKIKQIESDISQKGKDCTGFLEKNLQVNPELLIAWDIDTYENLKQTLVKKFNMNTENATSFLFDISKMLLQAGEKISSTHPQDSTYTYENSKNLQLADALDSSLIVALNNLVENAEEKSHRDYWSDICRGLMMLGANPLSWMDGKMGSLKQVPESDSHGFFVAARQATLILSSLTNRARYLGENVLHQEEKLDALIKAVDEFGQRLYSCIGDDTTWWWVPLSAMGFKTYSGARIERATIFWASVRWLYVSLNEQLIEGDACTVWTLDSQKALGFLDTAGKQYNAAVPQKNKLFNQGFESWHNLEKALRDFRSTIDAMALLRRQKVLAEKLDEKEAQETDARAEKRGIEHAKKMAHELSDRLAQESAELTQERSSSTQRKKDEQKALKEQQERNNKLIDKFTLRAINKKLLNGKTKTTISYVSAQLEEIATDVAETFEIETDDALKHAHNMIEQEETLVSLRKFINKEALPSKLASSFFRNSTKSTDGEEMTKSYARLNSLRD